MTTHAHPRPWLAGSEFGPGPRRKLCREARRIWSARVELARRAGRITALHALVGLALLRRLGEDGRLDPAHATLAHDAGCCPRTVRNALPRLRALGLLDWQRRIERVGRRVVQIANSYRLGVSGPPPAPKAGGKACRETPHVLKEEARAVPDLDRLEAQRALREVREARAGQLWGQRSLSV